MAAARPQQVLVKVILETCYLSAEQIVAACRLSAAAGADFVKTSTGFGVNPGGPIGATPEAVRLMLDTVGDRLGVKASGGIRTWGEAVMYLAMGCRRLGVGDAAAILDGSVSASDYLEQDRLGESPARGRQKSPLFGLADYRGARIRQRSSRVRRPSRLPSVGCQSVTPAKQTTRYALFGRASRIGSTGSFFSTLASVIT